MKPAAVATICVVLGIVGWWGLLYASESDPKNINYVLWKCGLYRLSLDTAVQTMIGDVHRDTLVLGKTRAELQHDFGYLRSASQASAYLRGCYEDSAWKNRSVLFIGDSPWMVVFDEDRATQLVLVKGC